MAEESGGAGDRGPDRHPPAGCPGRGGVPRIWLWSSGRCSGVTDDQQRARTYAEQAAVSGGWKARLEQVVLGLGEHLERVYVPTGIRYDGIALDGQVAWVPELPGVA